MKYILIREATLYGLMLYKGGNPFCLHVYRAKVMVPASNSSRVSIPKINSRWSAYKVNVEAMSINSQ